MSTRAINNLYINADSFHITLDEYKTEDEDEKPNRVEIGGWIMGCMEGGYQAAWHIRGCAPEQGDTVKTQKQAMAALTGVLIGILKETEAYEGSLLAQLNITAN